MFNTRQDLKFGGAIGSKFIGHDHPGHVAQALQQLAKEARSSLLVAAILHQHIEYVSMLINRSPEVVQFASDADENLVEKPLVSGFRPALLKGLGVNPSEAQAPLADGLIADHDASRREDQ